jgi:hypothetical protein
MNAINPIIITDCTRTSFGAMVFDTAEGKCLRSSAMVATKAEAQERLDRWLEGNGYKGGAKA